MDFTTLIWISKVRWFFCSEQRETCCDPVLTKASGSSRFKDLINDSLLPPSVHSRVTQTWPASVCRKSLFQTSFKAFNEAYEQSQEWSLSDLLGRSGSSSHPSSLCSNHSLALSEPVSLCFLCFDSVSHHHQDPVCFAPAASLLTEMKFQTKLETRRCQIRMKRTAK